MKKSLKKKLITGTAIAGFGLASLVGPMNNSVKAGEKGYSGSTGGFAEFIEEDTPAGVPIKILRSIFGGGKNQETHVHIHQNKERNNYQQPQRNYVQEKMLFLEEGKEWFYKNPNGKFFPAKLEEGHFYYKNYKNCWTPVKNNIKIKIRSQ